MIASARSLDGAAGRIVSCPLRTLGRRRLFVPSTPKLRNASLGRVSSRPKRGPVSWRSGCADNLKRRNSGYACGRQASRASCARGDTSRSSNVRVWAAGRSTERSAHFLSTLFSVWLRIVLPLIDPSTATCPAAMSQQPRCRSTDRRLAFEAVRCPARHLHGGRFSGLCRPRRSVRNVVAVGVLGVLSGLTAGRGVTDRVAA
jgi:hypothetical protein